MLETPFEGSCQCGAVRYRCTAMPFVEYACHCVECRRLSSSAFTLCAQVPAEALSVVAGDPVERTRVADSGNRLTTSFCSQCGSALFASNSARPRLRTIFAGTLDDADKLEVSAHVWTKRKLPWVVIPDSHRDFPEQGDWRAEYASDPSRLEG